MTDAALERNGLQRQDGRFSDHLPLVIDLRLQN
jgi:endonuclease/exonuclease/phosphatase family metal-dependent hydrolase